MIDTEHLDMDTIDNASDMSGYLYNLGDECVLCGEPAMPNAMYCESCAEKWLDEEYHTWKKSRDLE